MTRAVVVGGGIGGLTTALCLDRAGIEVLVVEQNSCFGDVGAGIQLSPNATRILLRLGLDLTEAGASPGHVHYRRWADDRMVVANALGRSAERAFGAPYCDIYRPDLIRALARRLSPASIRFDTCCVEVTVADSGRARVAFPDGTAEVADIVVGADGVHSQVRACTVGDISPRFSGAVGYRMLLPREDLPAELPHVVTYRMGPDRFIVSYFIGRDRSLLNLVCIVPEPTWTHQSWTVPGSADELRAHFAAWSQPVRDLLDLVKDPVYRYALHDIAPLERWSHGPVTLVGDACHAMLPFMAQGGSQAVEDAATLARCLTDGNSDIPTALDRYQRHRRPRTTELQRLSAHYLSTWCLPDGAQQRARDQRLVTKRDGPLLSAYTWVYAHDAEGLAERTLPPRHDAQLLMKHDR